MVTVIRLARPIAGGLWWKGTTRWNDETSKLFSTNIITFIQLRDYALERVNYYWPRDQNQGPLYTEPVDLSRQVRDWKGSKPNINTVTNIGLSWEFERIQQKYIKNLQGKVIFFTGLKICTAGNRIGWLWKCNLRQKLLNKQFPSQRT
jgi:hypothetical protein